MTKTTNSLGAGAMWLTFGNEALQAIHDCRWQIVCCVFMLIFDFWWAYSENRHNLKNAQTEKEKKKYEWRTSLAIRRTCVKFVDYLTFLLVGVVIGLAITEPYELADHVQTAAAGILIGCGCDAVSAWGHICVVHRWNFKPSDRWKFLKRFAVALIKKKSEDVGEALEETFDKEQNMED